jgi:transglutaminase-like putative cysteine protease
VRLTIVHTTTYRYARPVAFNPHRLMLRPRGGADLHVLSHRLDLSPAGEVAWAQDVFGNLVATARIAARAAELTITSRLELDATAPSWPVFPIDPRAQTYPFELTSDEALDLAALRAPDRDPTVTAWARGFVLGPGTDTLSLLNDLNAGVLAAAAYRPREEEGTQTAAETLRAGSGSCRDLAALFIEAARALGFGARAVSGYIFDPQDPHWRSDTTHAWAEVFLPGAGWIAFDPTHGRTGGGGLIAVAVGRCNAQTMPVAGSYVGAPGDFDGMEVDVSIEAEPLARKAALPASSWPK